jgi:hypothetical protein
LIDRRWRNTTSDSRSTTDENSNPLGRCRCADAAKISSTA